MKKILFYFSFFTVLLFLFTACTVHLDTLNQKTIKKCSACEDFLNKNQVYEAPYRAYDRGIQKPPYDLDRIKANRNRKTKPKPNFMDFIDYEQILQHTFCFNGLKKAEIEKRFGKGLKKSSFSRGKSTNEEWETAYNFAVGVLNKDSVMILISGSFIYDYEIIKGDTLYRPLPTDIQRLKKCLDADGVKYKE